MNNYQMARAIDEEAVEEIEEAEEIGEAVASPRRWAQALSLLLGALGLQKLASYVPGFIETFYSRLAYQYIGRIITIVNQSFGFSLAEAFAVLFVVGIFLWLLWLIQKVWNGFLSIFDFIGYVAYRALWATGIVWVLFLLLWGFNYQRLPLAQATGLEAREIAAGELEALGSLLVNQMNLNYAQARESQTWANDDRLPLTRPMLHRVIEESFQRTELLQRSSQGGFGPPKPLMFSPIISKFGISGMFSPFTGEPNYNEEVPGFDLPLVIAHEKAHQRGYAREDEASFVGFITCAKAGDPFVRYSGYLFAAPKILNLLAKTNPDEYGNLLARIQDGPRNDLRARAAFWNHAESMMLGELARRTNNTYLRANRVRSGIANYDEVTALIISYFQRYPNGERVGAPAPLTADAPLIVTPTPRPPVVLDRATPTPRPPVVTASPLVNPPATGADMRSTGYVQ